MKKDQLEAKILCCERRIAVDQGKLTGYRNRLARLNYEELIKKEKPDFAPDWWDLPVEIRRTFGYTF